MPLLLSSLSGKPVLAPAWSGHLDFLDGRYCKLLDGEVKPLPPECINEWLIKDSSWHNVNYQKASESMKNCFYFYKPYLEKAEELRKQNEVNFSTQAMDRKFWEFLDNNVPKFAVEQKLILPKLKKINIPKLTETPTTTLQSMEPAVENGTTRIDDREKYDVTTPKINIVKEEVLKEIKTAISK